MKLRTTVSTLALAIGLLSSAMPAWADFWSDAGKDLQGTTIRGVTESTPPSNYVKDVLAPAFSKATGIKVEFETTSWDQMFDKEIKDMEAKTGLYDVVYIEQDIIYSYLARNFLVDITKTMADKPKLKAPDFDPANFTTFIDYFKDPAKNNNLFAVPMESFIKTYLYRKDLFGDPEAQKSFKAKYGYDLAPPKDHKQYTDIAEFFTQWGKSHDMQLWGSTVQAHTGHPASWYEFVESVEPTFGVYSWGIVPEKNFAASVKNGGSMNGPKAVAALTWFLNNLKYAPPESTQSTWDEVAATFAAGRAAQGLVYGDYFDGGAFAIPTSSKNKDAALLFLEFIGQPSVQADWAVAGSRITLKSTYDDPKVKAQDEKTDHYYTLMKEKGKLFAGAPTYPFHAQVREAVAPIFYHAITGELTPQQALDKMADAAEAELTQLGYRKK